MRVTTKKKFLPVKATEIIKSGHFGSVWGASIVTSASPEKVRKKRLTAEERVRQRILDKGW